ncbi:hypothetical protein ACJX0J_009013, partial [Zea mays]
EKAGDWLQGPYVYYLYSQYGFDKGDIGRLFIAGFGSSMLFGTIVGSLADKQGRKRACVTYCITYILSCITKHSPQYKVLMIGRVLGGIATSLLFSAFESWLVAEHNKKGFDPQWLSITFSKAIFLGNGLVAIVAGLFANFLADNMGFGPVAPFDAAACFLAIGMAIILSSWGENYGDSSDSKDLITQFKGAAKAIASDEKIALLGAIQSLFEGSMYTFVFLWTPALSPKDEEIPHGFIFATFMLSSMLGSSIASRLLARKLKVEGYMQIVFSVSAFTLFLPVVTNFLVPPSGEKGGSISLGGCLQLLGFCTFESCVGIFWPSIMKMRSQYIPEEARSTIMNFFRIPLNLFVCVVLYNVNAFPITVIPESVWNRKTRFLLAVSGCHGREHDCSCAALDFYYVLMLALGHQSICVILTPQSIWIGIAKNLSKKFKKEYGPMDNILGHLLLYNGAEFFGRKLKKADDPAYQLNPVYNLYFFGDASKTMFIFLTIHGLG